MASGMVVKLGKTYLTKRMIARLGWGKALALLSVGTLVLKAFDRSGDEDVTTAVEEGDETGGSADGDAGAGDEVEAGDETGGDDDSEGEGPADEGSDSEGSDDEEAATG